MTHELSRMNTIDTVTVPPRDEMDALLREKDLYIEHQQPFDFLHLIIVKTADGQQIWTRRRIDVQALFDETLQFLRDYKKE